jgi:hypothetical protein
MTLQGGDVSAIVLATTFNALDHCMKWGRHFMGCAALVQLWFAGYFSHPLHDHILSLATTFNQRSFKFQGSLRATIKSEILHTQEDDVEWCILPQQQSRSVVLFINTEDKLMVLPGLVGGVQYHLVRVLRQFGKSQIPFQCSDIPSILRSYHPGGRHIILEMNDRLNNGVCTIQLGILFWIIASNEYLRMKQEYWTSPFEW